VEKLMLRALSRGLVLGGTIIEAIAQHARMSAKGEMPLPARAEWLHRWCGICLRRLGVDYTYRGLPPRDALLVANHLSYLDVLVLSAITPCIFVAKQEVAAWPVFGRMARLSGTIFVDRSRRGDVHSVAAKISEAVQSGTVVVIFPEGGSSNGRSVLPFHSSLLEPAVDLQLPVTPAHLSYTMPDGDPETDICYWGDMTLAPHLLKLLSRHGIRSVVRFGKPQTFADRKQAALQMRAEILRLAAGDNGPVQAVIADPGGPAKR
jgi:1-acyl-sn-glycerol-3-phosphate acyltransferase